MDNAEIEFLYRKYGRMVLRRAQAILSDAQAAQDVMHEVFLNVLRTPAAFRRESSPVTWLYRATTNQCLNALRSGRRRSAALALGEARSSAPGSPDARVELTQLLFLAPDEVREIAIYYFVDQMNREEIAELLGISVRTVGYRVEAFRAMAHRISPPVAEARS
jgi:RNA polymerase sigma factor (sigma-70 family)